MNRRAFLKASGAWSSLLALGHQANAQTVNDYKALVCIFMYGGNDAFNTVLATDTSSWAAYNSLRSLTPSSIGLMAPGTAADSSNPGISAAFGGVLPLNLAAPIANRSFALHPKLTHLAQLFNTSRRLAVVANVGPLVQPLTKAQYKAIIASGSTTFKGLSIPKKLFSHNDQQNTWQALAPEGATTGWGGLMADSWYAANPSLSPNPNPYTAISVLANAVWLSGKNVAQYQMTNNGAIALGGSSVYGSTKVAAALKRIATNGLAGPGATGLPRASHVMMADLGAVGQRSINLEAAVTAAFKAVPATDARVGNTDGSAAKLQYTNIYGFTALNPLAQQLQAVARMIAARSTLGAGRQVFFVQMTGFDNHDNQTMNHADLMLKLDHGMAYFDDALTQLGVQNQVTTFTASDFGRTFTSNGDGTDHGWGGHHFVMGGAVSGGKIYGTFPTLGVKNSNNNQFDSSDDLLDNGVMLPTTSVDQLGATLATWFGVNQPEKIFTKLGNFTTKNLGFLAA